VALSQTSLQEGISQLEEASRLDPNRPDVLNALGAALRKAGEKDRSADAFRRAREASAALSRRSEADLATNRAIDLLKKGQVEPAIEALRSALNAKPDSADANHYMGIAQSAQGHWAEANQAFNAAVLAGPSNPEILFNYGVALEKQNNWSGAALQFERAAYLRPGQPQAACMLADALARGGDSERAKAALQRARELGPCNISSH
jgi:Tfp pilus assembly protein PilF